MSIIAFYRRLLDCTHEWLLTVGNVVAAIAILLAGQAAAAIHRRDWCDQRSVRERQE